mmetsp:Transcript_11277/g.17147  ORF Transcript_11277/g.17147 Transcript_11277/m.17147 type:complete len:790 (+) Transcript_11277:77-2446(+)
MTYTLDGLGDSKSDFCSKENYDTFPCNMGVDEIVSLSLVGAAISILMCVYLTQKLKGYDRGSEKMQKLSDSIASGSRSFLITEYKYLTGFVFCVAAILLLMFSASSTRTDDTDGIRVAGCFIAGALLSATAGWVGMIVATDANTRTTHAADKLGLNAALRVAFSGGAVMGFCVVGLGLFGVSIFLILMSYGRDSDDISSEDAATYPNKAVTYQWAAESLAGFGFGASSIALFARVTGGIYTKAADVGADLVGKVEQGIPEDDPRNPAVIADNVGDNVGDVAGMGADLFESFVGSIIATVTLAEGDVALMALPFWLAGAGVLSSWIGYWFVSTKDDASQKDLLHALHKAVHSASFLVIVFSIFICWGLFPGRQSDGWRCFGCIILGLFCGVLIGELTEYFTSYSYKPVKSITDAGLTGPATVIIQGLGVGMISCVGPIFVIVFTVICCNALAGEYGIAIAAVGMLSTLAVTLATDAYGPVADNAGGIAEMAELDERVRDTTDALDALGNTTAATGKGFAIGSAVLTAVSLLSAFEKQADIEGQINMGDPIVFSGMLFGAMLPYLFAALTMLSVRKAAAAIIEEVRRQFHTIPGLMEGTAEPDSERCVEICTVSSVQEMVLPGAYAILSPLFIGFLVGPRCLAGLLGGSIASGAMLAIMMSTAGGAWDNSKKYIEIEKACGGKGTDTHKACVVGDTVGDPFKDTSGPALNILIKLMSIISLTVAPLIAGNDDWDHFYYGFIPVIIGIAISWYCYEKYWKGDITYKDYAKGDIEGSGLLTENTATAHDSDAM